ncbi:uncharacterized protein LOC119594794 [Penaeus monodon]|uniref:uncharacterized protein LOC119594794 n=1 Tax=Penaeus monodon TaxID=6687 RepID=UPI0018A6D752|nr:uncharacterized protein LOC119594794 [Penaeus monodon]
MHDVDRYRGSCLFVSKPRGRGQAHLRTRGPSQENQHHHQSQQQQQQQQQQQSGGGGGGGNHSSSHGAHPPPHMDSSYVMEGGSALAGMPLFSFLPQRRGSLWNPGRVQHHGRQQRSPSHHQAGHQQQHHVHHYLGPQEPSGGSDAGDGLFSSEDGDELERLPLARLALHTQGAPLILPSRSSPRSSPPCSGLGARPVRELAHGDASPPAGSDAVSVTSDEGSTGHADTSLPRIIKPRKRRKKDRKPAPGSPPPGPGEGERGADPEAADASGSIVTLKPYMPMCYNYDAAGDDQGPRGCESSRACGCGHCVAGHVFPTPPPSPASSSAMSSAISSSSSSSCSSSSEDEPGGAGGAGGDGRSQLVRSLSEPQPAHPTIHISSTVMHSFAGHRDLDIRILRSVPRDVPTRTRHWSVPAAARNHPHPTHTPQARGSSSYPSSACSAVSLLDGGASQSPSYAAIAASFAYGLSGRPHLPQNASCGHCDLLEPRCRSRLSSMELVFGPVWTDMACPGLAVSDFSRLAWHGCRLIFSDSFNVFVWAPLGRSRRENGLSVLVVDEGLVCTLHLFAGRKVAGIFFTSYDILVNLERDLLYCDGQLGLGAADGVTWRIWRSGGDSSGAPRGRTAECWSRVCRVHGNFHLGTSVSEFLPRSRESVRAYRL